MTDYSALKKAAEVAAKPLADFCDVLSLGCKAKEILGLIAENERLRSENDEPEWHAMMTKLEDQNVQIKAEVESLRKELAARHPFKHNLNSPLIGHTGCVICGQFTDHQGLPCPQMRAFSITNEQP